jgi:hypothetical protein
MKKYKITIEEIIKETQEEQKYPRKETIYEQIFEDDETKIENVIKSVNGIAVTY